MHRRFGLLSTIGLVALLGLAPPLAEAQSQAGKTGIGVAAGQEFGGGTSVTTNQILLGVAVAAVVGAALAIASSDASPVATTTATTTAPVSTTTR